VTKKVVIVFVRFRAPLHPLSPFAAASTEQVDLFFVMNSDFMDKHRLVDDPTDNCRY
jgi:hypothetical protein